MDRVWSLLLVVCAAGAAARALLYHTYSGAPLTASTSRHYTANTPLWCVNEIELCDEEEGRRVDGSCNNLQSPARGTTYTPFSRLLPPSYHDGDKVRDKAASGNSLPLPRRVRTRLMSVGRVPSGTMTSLLVYFITFMGADAIASTDTVNYLRHTTHCCTERGHSDPTCAPLRVPDDDPVHRFSGVTCFNMTRPLTYQQLGCIDNHSPPERLAPSTPLLDLSVIYGNTLEDLLQKGRLFKGGLLKYETDDDGRTWPPSYKDQHHVCQLNQLPRETRCHLMPEASSNNLMSTNLVSVWFWRHHNHVAEALSRVSPCWSDDKLFDVARDINIAVALQIYYYEALPPLLGLDNLLSDGVLSADAGFRDQYNVEVLPQVSYEYPYALRWFHNIQDGAVKLYDETGRYLRQVPFVNLTFRTGYLGVDDNMDHVTLGSFRQPSARPDHILDPDVADWSLGPLQRASDITTNDLAKGRYFGFQPYVNYTKFCFGKQIKKFADLRGTIDDERIEILREVYERVEDVELLAGMWAERRRRGASVPPTVYCLMVQQLQRYLQADRHWYERRTRPHAFTYSQLSEVRKASIARLLCDVGDKVRVIQPSAFLRVGPTNTMLNCTDINNINYNEWRDHKCSI